MSVQIKTGGSVKTLSNVNVNGAGVEKIGVDGKPVFLLVGVFLLNDEWAVDEGVDVFEELEAVSVMLMFVPVSPSGTGKTFSSLTKGTTKP